MSINRAPSDLVGCPDIERSRYRDRARSRPDTIPTLELVSVRFSSFPFFSIVLDFLAMNFARFAFSSSFAEIFSLRAIERSNDVFPPSSLFTSNFRRCSQNCLTQRRTATVNVNRQWDVARTTSSPPMAFDRFRKSSR